MTLQLPSDTPRLSDGVITLRAWAPEDAGAVFDACQDPEIQRWTTVPVPYERHHASAFVGERATASWEAGDGAPFCISGQDEQVLGACGLVSIDHDRLIGEMGYWIAPDARGMSAATHAVRLLTDWAFGCGLCRLELYIEPENAGSIAVAERAGYEREGLLRSMAIVQGQRRDMLLYALVR